MTPNVKPPPQAQPALPINQGIREQAQGDDSAAKRRATRDSLKRKFFSAPGAGVNVS